MSKKQSVKEINKIIENNSKITEEVWKDLSREKVVVTNGELTEEVWADLTRPEPTKKIRTKKSLEKSGLTDEELDELQKGNYDENGHMLNDAGQAISLENGYSDADVEDSKAGKEL